MIKVGIIGATGYVGMELVRLLANHPGVRLTSLVSQNYVGKKMSDVYPSLRNVVDMECEELNVDEQAERADIFITALPHGVSKQVIPALINKGRKVIDHSGDFRYRDVKVYEQWYGMTHEMPELLDKAVYGLPELYRKKIRNAQLVGNPGCYPTSSILAAAPILSSGLGSTDNIIIDSASGITGAGRKTDLPYQFCEADGNFKAYAVGTHRHTSEIEQELSLLAGKDVMISFTPHLLPIKRGILSTLYINLNKTVTAGELVELYKSYYEDEFFVRIMKEGALPEIKNVAGSNFIDIGIAVDKRLNRAVIVSSLDNLGKGAAGQAVQVMNIMAGYNEETGLDRPGLYL
ncbi:MAG: N-acetyl-gamma-glutamyl-phosphate reductase [Eubacteriales bacterium]|nr:N-acetyl-gamma-glutamyl-phosphate reductase [Eubacteriales bacterium]